MKNADEFMQLGYDLCFGNSSKDSVKKGREYFSHAAELGRSDAYFYLGRSYEKQHDYIEAERQYQIGLEEGHILAVYRLALLHDGSKLNEPDRNFYLKTLERLASEEYAPAISRRSRERIFGSYGLAKFFLGLVMFLPDFYKVFRIAYSDPDGPMIRS